MILCIGELLVDLIGKDIAHSLLETIDFQRLQGGSPANLAANLGRLGAKVAVVSAVGNDGLGKYLIEEIKKTGVSTDFIEIKDLPTSLVLVSRTQGTPDFIAYRMADKYLSLEKIDENILTKTKLVHTTCFALSQNPAQTSILDFVKKAKKKGVLVSIDANYAPSIGPKNRVEVWEILKKYLSGGGLLN